jgi:bifunctional ADP-heptose synthase (sugar kinase/adenylyltransferase)
MTPDSAEANIAEAAAQGANAATTLVVGNVVLSTVLSASLNSLFSMVEAQQLVCIIMCSQITLPPLPAVIVSLFFQIANFDILNVGYVYEKVFYMPPADPVNANFAAVGFGDSYFINNLGSILLSILGFLAL